MLVVGAMVLIIAIAALAIDVGQWYSARHQAQVTADAAALAAANCLATGACANQAAAQSQAIDYAAKNGFTIGQANITFPTSSTVRVTVPANQGTFFSGVFNVMPRAQSEPAVASWSSSLQQCGSTSGGPNCLAYFALSTSCNPPAFTSTSNSTSVDGVVYSNGGISNTGNSHSSFPDPAYYNSSCSTPSGFTDPVTTSNTQSYPLVYSGPSGGIISGSDGSTLSCNTPSSVGSGSIVNGVYQGSFTYSGGSGVFCATGTITISSSTPSGGATFAAPTVKDSGGSDVTAYDWPNNELAIYQEDSLWTGSTCSSAPSGTWKVGGNLTGIVFAPCSNFEYDGNNATVTGMVEAYTIDLAANNTAIGTGPLVSGGGGPFVGGTDKLVQ